MEFEDFTCIHEAKFKDGRFIYKYYFEEHKNSYASGILNALWLEKIEKQLLNISTNKFSSSFDVLESNFPLFTEFVRRLFQRVFSKSAEHNQRNTSKRDKTNSSWWNANI